MRYRGIMVKLKNEADSYKAFILNQVDKWQQNEAAIDRYLDINSAYITTKEGRTKYRAEHGISDKIKPVVEKQRKEVLSRVNPMLGRLYKNVCGYFNSPVDPEFSARITALAAVGGVISEAEARIMVEMAKSYSEKQLIQAYFNNVLKDKTDDSGNAWVEKALATIYLPTADEALKEFEDFKNDTLFFYNNYSGEHGEIASMVTNTDQIIAIGAFHYCTHDKVGEYEQKLKSLADMIPGSSKLTHDEKMEIDRELQYVSDKSWKIKSLAKDPEWHEILCEDERYCQYLYS